VYPSNPVVGWDFELTLVVDGSTVGGTGRATIRQATGVDTRDLRVQGSWDGVDLAVVFAFDYGSYQVPAPYQLTGPLDSTGWNPTLTATQIAYDIFDCAFTRP
jgi:hypothetical protein